MKEYPREKNRSMDDICRSIWFMAFSKGYKDNEALEPTDNHLAHLVLDFLPPTINKWLEGRMSLSKLNYWTPERVTLRLLAIEFLLKNKY